MTLEEMRPRAGEKFYPWLARVDAPTFAYSEREHHTAEETEAYRRGFFEGEHSLLFKLYEALDKGVKDADLLVRMMSAGMIALRRRRTPLDFRLALEHHGRTNDEVPEHRGPDADGSTEGGLEDMP